MWSVLLALAACNSDPGTPSDPHGPDDPPATGPTDPGGGDDDDDDSDCVPAGGAVVNELSPANVGALLDEDGDSPDWIELTNADTVPVDLEGWSLTDDKDEPQKWQFPAITLDPGDFLLVYASGKDRQRTVATWDTRVDQGDDWRYLEVLGPPAAGWFAPEYDAGAWPIAPSGFGFGDLDDATAVSANTVYLRTDFVLTADEVADVRSLLLHVDYDDGFVAYLGGVEVARAGIGTAGTVPAWDEFASSSHEAQIFEGKLPPAFDLVSSIGLLREGANTLAVEVHNGSPGSTDLSVIPFLTLGFASERPGRTSSVLKLSGSQLHTNFSLKADGERVRLYDPAGCEADDLEPVQLYGDQSYGRQPDGTGDLGYFLEPTPGAPNLTESRPGFSTIPTFDPPPAWYPGGTDVTVLSAPGAEVHVAWEGREPTESDPRYAAPVPTGDEDEAVVLRARAWEAGLWPSRVATATYLLRQPGTLPIVSLVTDPPNLWDDETGIYTAGVDHGGPPEFVGANFWEDWERPVHMAEWEPDGTMGFAVDAGLAIHGGYTRHHDQKSLLVELSSGYGDDTIEHDVFPGLGITSFDRLLLRAGGNDWLGCMEGECSKGAHLRDSLMQQLAAPADLETLAWRPVEVYLNGEYWGIYHLEERSDASYVAAHHGYEDIDLLEADRTPVRGDALAWEDTMAWLRANDLSDPANYDHVKTLIDVDQLQAYLAFEVFYDNTDWPGNNVKWWRPRTEDGRWRWMLYDTDFGLGLYAEPASNDSLAAALDAAGPSWPNPPWSTELFRLLLTSPEFERDFLNRYADHLNTSLAPATTRAALHELEDVLAPEMPRHIERWGHWTDGVATFAIEPFEWEGQISYIDRWLGERPEQARQHVVTNFGLPGTWSLALSTDPPGAGTFELTAITVEEPFEGIYFQGVPVTITAVPAAGFTFDGWSEPGLPATPTVTLSSGGPLDVVARFR